MRKAVTSWLVPLVLCACAPAALASDQCELPDGMSSFVRPTSRVEEFRIALTPPDYASAEAVRRHFLLSTAWAAALEAEIAARSQGSCDATIRPSLFPDLRASLVGYRSAKGQSDYYDAVCVPLLQEVAGTWKPDESTAASALAKVSSAAARWGKGSALASRSYPFPSMDSMLRLALARIYDSKSVMHALTSLDAAAAHQTLAAGSLAEWIARQQSGQQNVAGLSICPTGPARLPYYKKRVAAFPLSATASAPTVAIAHAEFGKDLPAAFRHLMVIGDERPSKAKSMVGYAFSPYAVALEEKYCNRRHSTVVSGGPGQTRTITAEIKCQFATILGYDDWMVVFCDAKDCASAREAEAFMNLIAADPDMRAAKQSETDIKSRGPYRVSVIP